MKRVAIIGAGWSGLASGIYLLENSKDVQVTIYNMGHNIGGKALSYRDKNGYNIDHGFHAIFSKYWRLLHLLKRAGIKIKTTLRSNNGITYYYEEDSNKLHSVGSLFDPQILKYRYKAAFSPVENLQYASFLAKNYSTIMFEGNIEKYDDICYNAWAVQRGVSEQLIQKRSFRFSLDVLFNWPYEVSAYIMLMGFRQIASNPKYYFVNGNYGENIFIPLVNYFQKLGGKIELYKKLTGIEHENGRATGLVFNTPDNNYHQCGTNNWKSEVQVVKDSATPFKEFDAVILAIPVDNFMELNKNDNQFWNPFPAVQNLKSIITLSWQLWTTNPVLPKLKSVINGLDEPMPMVVDYKNIIDEYKKNDKIGSALEWVGQETSYEKYSDDELKEIILSSFMKIPYAKDPRKAGIIYDSFNRNSSNHERYLLTDPGTLKFRPKTITHINNLFLAGDWIRNEVDVPTMEGAICSGYAAGKELLKKISDGKI